MSKWVKITNKNHLPKISGCYVVYGTDNKVKYIGSSSNMFSRLQQHPKVNNKSIAYIKYCVVPNPDNPIFLEYCLIERIHTGLNKKTNRLIASCLFPAKMPRKKLLSFNNLSESGRAYFGENVKRPRESIVALFYWRKWKLNFRYR